MSRKKKAYVSPKECVAYLSTTGPLWEIEKREQKQERYIREYAKAHNIDVVGVVHRNGLGQDEVNKQINKIAELIHQRRVEGVILANMMTIATDVADAYYKVGKIKAAGGFIITVDEGELGMNVKECV